MAAAYNSISTHFYPHNNLWGWGENFSFKVTPVRFMAEWVFETKLWCGTSLQWLDCWLGWNSNPEIAPNSHEKGMSKSESKHASQPLLLTHGNLWIAQCVVWTGWKLFNWQSLLYIVRKSGAALNWPANHWCPMWTLHLVSCSLPTFAAFCWVALVMGRDGIRIWCPTWYLMLPPRCTS